MKKWSELSREYPIHIETVSLLSQVESLLGQAMLREKTDMFAMLVGGRQARQTLLLLCHLVGR